MVALYAHAILRFHHGHSRVLAQNIRQKALVIGRQMLNDDEGHARIAGKEGKKLLQRFQSSCRSPYSNYAAGLRVSIHFLIICVFAH